MKNKIILNWMPPAMTDLPSPAMSILKTYLENKGFEVKIIYWNILSNNLQKGFIWESKRRLDDQEAILIFSNYLAISRNDKQLYNKIKAILRAKKPQYYNIDSNFYDRHMNKFKTELENLIIGELASYNFSEILLWGMSVNLHQWICSSLIGEFIKKIDPQSQIAIGGIGNKEIAKIYLNSFTQFDYAMWGEGENTLHLLAQSLRTNNIDISEIPNIAYRNENTVFTSQFSNKVFLNLSDSSISAPDYSDYFTQIKLLQCENELEPSIPIESSRGCHWNKCHFCYLNKGYHYRLKENDVIINELIKQIQNYQIHKFQFLDNDVIGREIEKFDTLLDKLIELRTVYPEFSIILAEIVTKNLNRGIIKKMSLAGYKYVQIGYESLSDKLLTKIEKKNSFSSNLLFIKYAFEYNITINGANIIRNLLEECDDDIIECINNLHFLRFFLGTHCFQHTQSTLGITSSSRYYKSIIDNPLWNNQESILSFAPKNYLHNNDIKMDIVPATKIVNNVLWDYFCTIEKHYTDNRYAYTLIKKGGTTIEYKEIYNNNEINRIEFEQNSNEWNILLYCNDKPKSLDEMVQFFSLPTNDIIDILTSLRNESLIYYNDKYTEIISIINTYKIQ